MTYQLYHGEVNERETQKQEKVSVCQREWGFINLLKLYLRSPKRKKNIYTNRQAKGKPVPKEAKEWNQLVTHHSMDHARPLPFYKIINWKQNHHSLQRNASNTVSGSQFTYKTTSPRAFQPCATRNYLMNEMILTIHAALHTMTGCLTIPDLIHMISLIAHLLN